MADSQAKREVNGELGMMVKAKCVVLRQRLLRYEHSCVLSRSSLGAGKSHEAVRWEAAGALID